MATPLTAETVEDFIAKNPNCTSLSIERAFRFNSMQELWAVLGELERSGRVAKTPQNGPGHMFFIRFAVTQRRPTFHAVLIAAVASVAKTTAHLTDVLESIREGGRSRGVVRLALAEQRHWADRAARIHTYVANRACR